MATDNRIPSPLSSAADPKPGALGVWDRFKLNDVVLPGRAEVEVTQGAERKVDDRSAAGSDGWTLVDKGAQPVKYTVTLEFWESAQLETWLEQSERLCRRLLAGATRNAPRVYHPTLAALCVDRAYMQGVGGLKHAGKGLWRVAFKMVQYLPPTRGASAQAVQATPVTAATNAPNTLVNGAAGPGTRPPAQRNTTPPRRR